MAGAGLPHTLAQSTLLRTEQRVASLAGSGTYGIPQEPGTTWDYTGSLPGIGCNATAGPVVPGSGGYQWINTGSDPYGWPAEGGDPALVAALQEQPIKVSAPTPPR